MQVLLLSIPKYAIQFSVQELLYIFNRGGGSYQMFALRVRLFADGMPLLS